jgi:hypothetical protein
MKSVFLSLVITFSTFNANAQQAAKPQTAPEAQAQGPSANYRSDRDLKWQEIKQKEAQLIKEADQNGSKAATSSKTKFKAFSTKDQMSGVESIGARYEGSIGNGKATVDLFCDNGSLKSKFTFQGVTVPTFDFFRTGRIVSTGRSRLNGKVYQTNFEQDAKFNNIFHDTLGRVVAGRVVGLSDFGWTTAGAWTKIPSEGLSYYDSYYDNRGINQLADCPNESRLLECRPNLDRRKAIDFVIYDYANEFTTSGGAFFMEMNPYDPAIKRVADDCK